MYFYLRRGAALPVPVPERPEGAVAARHDDAVVAAEWNGACNLALSPLYAIIFTKIKVIHK